MTLLTRIEEALEELKSDGKGVFDDIQRAVINECAVRIRHLFAQPPTDEEVAICARAIHEAKIRSCWPKAMWNREPWEKANSAVPDQPWHDIARDQARAAITADRGK